MQKRVWLILVLVFLLVACNGVNAEADMPDAGVNSGVENGSVSPNENEANNNTPSESEVVIDEPEVEILAAYPVEREAISIVTEDGRTLEGYYYPAAVNPAPVIVMMHWAPGTLEDWQALAPWLQNRGNAEARMPILDCGGRANDFLKGPWLDETWFPALPQDVSFGVVVFNFGGCGNSEKGGTQESKLLDAKAAVFLASRLKGVDPFQISTLGASIGADGAVDACWLFNWAASGGMARGACIGAFSLSPGGYLTMAYGEAVGNLQGMVPPVPVVCLAAERDGPAPATCKEGTGAGFSPYIYSGGDHGMWLIEPEDRPIDPVSERNTLEIYLEFLALVFGVELIE